MLRVWSTPSASRSFTRHGSARDRATLTMRMLAGYSVAQAILTSPACEVTGRGMSMQACTHTNKHTNKHKQTHVILAVPYDTVWAFTFAMFLEDNS